MPQSIEQDVADLSSAAGELQKEAEVLLRELQSEAVKEWDVSNLVMVELLGYTRRATSRLREIRGRKVFKT